MGDALACKIAIVDSGIDLDFYKNHVIKYVEYTENTGDESEYDSNGHGTLCCSTMLSINPDIQFVVIKILNEKNLCSDERLLRALNLLKDVDVDIINLSLSTYSMAFSEQYKKIVADLAAQGKVIIAAAANGNIDSLLSGLRGTIGIYGNLFESPDDYWYKKTDEVQCVANCVPYLYRGKRGQYELFGGNSKATAVFSGIVSLHWDKIKNCSFADKETFLEGLAKRQSWSKEDICLNPLSIKEYTVESVRDEIYLKVADIMAEKLKVGLSDVMNSKGKRLYEWGLTRYNVFGIVKAIEKEIGIKLTYSNINIFWFSSIDTLCNKIREAKDNLKSYE